MAWYATYPPALQELIVPKTLPPLGPGEPDSAAYARLKALRPADLFAPQTVRDDAMAQCCLAGLWLLHNYHDESHRISQDVDTTSGSYWHAILHRREPDPGNSKYWFRRVGNHPVLASLREQAPALGYLFGDPFAFVDFVEQVRGTATSDEELAKRVQQLEWELLFDYCYRAAG